MRILKLVFVFAAYILTLNLPLIINGRFDGVIFFLDLMLYSLFIILLYVNDLLNLKKDN